MFYGINNNTYFGNITTTTTFIIDGSRPQKCYQIKQNQVFFILIKWNFQ